MAGFITVPAHAEVKPVTRAIDGFIRPAYGHFHQATVTFESDMVDLCAAPSEDLLAAARIDFSEVMEMWSRVETIRFGPVTVDNRLERILFWPDRKSIGLKQVQAALAEKDPTATDPATLAKKSVALQGIGALEFVLFGTGFEELAGDGGAYRCAYGRAIATNLERMASAISAEWNAPDGFAHQWANPAAENPLYRNDGEAVTELFDVFVHGLEMIRDVRIKGFVGDEPKFARPKQAIYWRSGGTIISIAANLTGLETLFDAADFSPYLASDVAWIPDSIRFEFRNAERALGEVHGSVEEMLADRDMRKKLEYARLVTSSLSELFGERLAGALGLSAGFSSLDGD